MAASESANPDLTPHKPSRPWRRIPLTLRLLVILIVTLGVVAIAWLVVRNHKTSIQVPAIQSQAGGADTDSVRTVYLRVVERVYDVGEWRTAGDVVVNADGNYRRTVFNMGDWTSTSTNGRIPDPLMRTLQEEVSKNSGFTLRDGVPTYEFGIDDHRVKHPAGVSELLRLTSPTSDE